MVKRFDVVVVVVVIGYVSFKCFVFVVRVLRLSSMDISPTWFTPST
jgi:hypothetical protein